jgi:fructose-1,6-bisphosphatase II
MHPRDEDERRRLIEEHGCSRDDLSKVWSAAEMAKGDHIIFVATGISDSPMLPGIRYENHHCVTESMLIRARHRTLRRIVARHDIDHKTIRLASRADEVGL